MDAKISLHKLQVSCVIGVHSFERLGPQTIEVDLDLWGSFTQACQTDLLSETVDYVKAAQIAGEILQTGGFQLLEAAANQIARSLLKESLIQKVRVKLKKPGALSGAQGACFELTLTKNESLNAYS